MALVLMNLPAGQFVADAQLTALSVVVKLVPAVQSPQIRSDDAVALVLMNLPAGQFVALVHDCSR